MNKKKISLEELEKSSNSYLELYETVMDQIKKGKLIPIGSSKLNGKRPALYRSYWSIPEPFEGKKYEQELKYELNPRLSNAYYLRNLKIYEKDRNLLKAVNYFFNHHFEKLREAVSLNERSFQIWQQEKFLQIGEGKRILKNLGLALEDLNIYHTAEPLAYYSRHKSYPQNILIIENKDTFYTMRKHLLNGSSHILGLEIGTLIYGGGKGVSKAFGDFEHSVEPYLLESNNCFYYFGDLDYEGIAIFHQLNRVKEVKPFTAAYLQMIQKCETLILPKTKAGQIRLLEAEFFNHFDEGVATTIKEILEKDDYIPQEILTMTDL